jgi:hypothetical protein
MQLIAHQELTSAAASITFSSIPQTYTDLYLTVSVRSSSTANDFYRINLNSSALNFSGRFLGNDGTTSVASGTSAPPFGRVTQSDYTANTFSNCSWYIPNYTAATSKSISVDTVSENNGGEYYLNIEAGLWSVSDPITSVSFVLGAGNFVQYSSATLYGILAGSSGGVTVS